MSHIWSQAFYDQVKENINAAKNNGFVLFYEWVRPGTEKNLDDFNEAIWIEFSPDLYKNFSKLYWVAHQKNPEFLWIFNDNDFNIDLDINTIMNIYREKTWETNQVNQKRWEQEIADISRDIIDQLSHLSERELAVMRYINKSILNFIIKNAGLRDTILQRFWNQNLFAVILDSRNEFLAENIVSSEYNNIFVMYGLMHYTWVLEILQSQDPNWKVIQTTYTKLID